MKKKFLGFISIFLILILSTTRVSAISLAKAGDDVLEEGDYNSVRFVAGNKVTSRANIDGISFIAGNEIVTEGTSTYGIYAGNNISIKENILNDLFVAGNKIVVTEDTIIGRDAFIAGANVTVKAKNIRELRIGANIINISGVTVSGDAYLLADNIVLDENTVITGKLTYPEDAKIMGLDVAKVGEIVKTEKVDINVKKDSFGSVKNVIFSICAGIIIMLILFYVLPKTKDKLDNVELKFEPIIKLVCIGFLMLILVPITFFITVFTNILTPFALILGCVYGISIYLGSLLSAYVIGNLLTKKLLRKDNKYLALVIGIVLVKLIKLIPIVGGFLGVICLLYGMGLITTWIKKRNV